MFPYHASSKLPSPSPAVEEGGGEKVIFAREGDDIGGSMVTIRIGEFSTSGSNSHKRGFSIRN